MNIQPPYAVFLGDTTDQKAIKTAMGLIEWTDHVKLEVAMTPETVSTNIALNNAGVYINRDVQRVITIDDMKTAIDNLGIRSFIITSGAPGNQFFDWAWKPWIQAALECGCDVVNPLHSRLKNSFPRYDRVGSEPSIIDIRFNDDWTPTVGRGVPRSGQRLLTIGQDSNIGKKYTALMLSKTYALEGGTCTFRPTGQTGRMIAPEHSIVLDTVPADFMTGAVEWLSPANEAHHLDIIEGQGSIDHPSFAPGAVALLLGSQPDYLVLCVDFSRKTLRGTNYEISGLREVINLSLLHARRTNPRCKLIGVSLRCEEHAWNHTRSFIAATCGVEQDDVFDANNYAHMKTFSKRLHQRVKNPWSKETLIHTNSRSGDWL